MSQKLEQLNVSSISSSAPSPSYEICGSIDHLAMNCQVSNPFAPYVSEPVKNVNNLNPRLTNDLFSNTYNPG